MMKKLVIIFGVLAVLAIGVLVVVASRAGSIVEEYTPELEQLASESLGAQVSLGDLSVSVFPRARVVVDAVSVTNPAHPEERIQVGQVVMELDLFSLLGGTITISTLRITEPTITLRLEEDGFFVEGLARETQASAPEEEASTATETSLPIALKLNSFIIDGASILVKDAIADTEYSVKDLGLYASFSFSGDQAHFTKVRGAGVFMETIPFEYTGDGLRYGLDDGVMGLEKVTTTTMSSTLLFDGELSPDDATKEITIESEGVDLAGLDPALTIFAPTAKAFGIHGRVQPDLVFALTPTGYRTSGTVKVSSLGARIEDLIGVESIAGEYALELNEAKQGITSESLTGTLNDAPFTVKMTAALDETSGTLKPFEIVAFGGSSTLTTALRKNDPTFPFNTTLVSEGMKVEELIPAFAPEMPFAVTGTIESIRATMSGTLTEDLLPSLKGNGGARLVDGLIKDVNLGQQVLSSVKGLPFLAGALLDAAPSELNRFLEQEHTVISEISGTFVLADEQAYSEDMKILSDFFELNAAGTVDLDTRLDLDAVIYFSPEFSAELADEIKELQVLLDGEGRLTFPVKITGIPPELVTVPDTSAMLKGAVKNTVRNEVKNKLNDLLNLGGDESAETGDSLDQTESPEEENIVDSIGSSLKGLFGGK